MRTLLLACSLLSSVAVAQQPAATSSQTPPVIPLWTGTAPGAQGAAQEDVPRIDVYLPLKTPGVASIPAVVVCPGGAYHRVAMSEEGYPAQRHLNALGIAVFILHYRVGPKYHHPVELGDAARAIRLVRSRAAEWGVDPARVGIMGFSAGGHLASTISTHFDAGTPTATDPIDRMSSRPDFAILVYPVISFDDAITHQGSKHNLLGDHPDSALVANLSNERMVTSTTPPTFLIHGFDDNVVPVENSLRYYSALQKAGVKSELHVFQNAEHGSGMGGNDPVLSVWPTLLANWLRINGWVPASN